MKQVFNNSNFKWITSAAAVIAILFVAGHVWADYSGHRIQTSDYSFVSLPLDTFPQSGEVIHIQKQTNDKSVKLSMENGVITNLEIDGKKIDEAEYDKYNDIISEVSPKSGSKGNNHFFFFGDDEYQNFGFGDFKIYRDSISKLMNNDFFKGFQSLGELDLDQIMGELSKQFENLDFGQQADSMWLQMKEPGGFSFNFRFPDDRDFRDNNGLWMDEMDKDATADTPKDVNLTDILGKALNEDGILIPKKMNKVELTGKYLKINGEKQPNNLFEKYKRILEDESGIELNKNSKLKFDIEGKTPKRKYRSF